MLSVNNMTILELFKFRIVLLSTTFVLISGVVLLCVNPGSIAQATERAVVQSINLTLGTLPAGKNIVFTFDATVGDLPSGTTQIANQAAISGSNFATTLTDDPTQPGASDPTILVAQSRLDPQFGFSKTVGIDGITPLCTTTGTIKVPVNTTVVYCYTIRNSGLVTLTTHTLSDDKLGMLLNNVSRTVAPSATFSHNVTATLTISTTNVATWTALSTVSAAEVNLPDAVLATVAGNATVLISAPTDDQDGDTIPDNVEGAKDVDRDNLPNFLDTNSDGDSASDQAEAGPNPLNPGDSNNDGIPDFLDPATPTGLDDGSEPGNRRVFLPLVGR